MRKTPTLAALVSCAACLCIAGCAAGISEGFQWINADKACQVTNECSGVFLHFKAGTIRNLTIDGVAVHHTYVYLVPGQHTALFEVYGETEEWQHAQQVFAEEEKHSNVKWTLVGPKYTWTPRQVTFTVPFFKPTAISLY